MSVYVVRLAEWGRTTLCRKQIIKVQGIWRWGLAGARTGTTGTQPWITATPRVCLHDVPTSLQAGGLNPNSPVTLAASVTDENGKKFVSHAHYVTDAGGGVDVDTSISVGGSYRGVFPAGLLTTLAPAPKEFSFLRLYRRDTSSPWKIDIKVSEGHQPLVSDAEAVGEVVLERHLMAPGVRRIPIHQGRVRGVLYMPPGDGPFPGVIDMFGTAGGLMEFRSAMLASRGIASLALAYFAYEDLPKTADEFDLNYFEEAVETLLSHEGVVQDRCGVVATSKAADIAFCMATWLSQVKAVVSISGAPVAFDSHITYRGSTIAEGIKFGFENIVMDDKGRLYPNRQLFVTEATPDHPKFIPFHTADDDTYFFMAGGTDDAWGCDLSVTMTRLRMNKLGRGDKLETVLYPGAGHILEPPYTPLLYHSYHRHPPVLSEDGLQKLSGMPMLWGGNARDVCRAQEDLWPRMRSFIIKHVRDSSPWYQERAR